MLETIITVIDNETNGGVPVKATVNADDRFVRIIAADKKRGWTIRVRREDILAAIETEEHG